MAAVSGLAVYPIKGCRGIACQEARICNTGFAYDRHWVVVQQKNDKFESQRKDPKMALIKTNLPLELLREEVAYEGQANLTITAPGQEDLEIPLGAERSNGLARCDVWGWTGEGYDEGNYAAEYLSDYMGHKVRLIRYAGQASQGTPQSASTRRPLDPNFAESNFETAFSDAMPFLLANEGSLADLNAKCKEEIPMDRFRPNIVVKGPEAWEEDRWQELRIGGVDFIFSMPTGRCTVTTVDQATAVTSPMKEPLRTLQTYRKGQTLGWTADKSWRSLVFFGWYLITSSSGVISVGDSVDVLKQREGAPQLLAPA